MAFYSDFTKLINFRTVLEGLLAIFGAYAFISMIRSEKQREIDKTLQDTYTKQYERDNSQLKQDLQEAEKKNTQREQDLQEAKEKNTQLTKQIDILTNQVKGYEDTIKQKQINQVNTSVDSDEEEIEYSEDGITDTNEQEHQGRKDLNTQSSASNEQEYQEVNVRLTQPFTPNSTPTNISSPNQERA